MMDEARRPSLMLTALSVFPSLDLYIVFGPQSLLLRRDGVAAMEKALAELLASSGLNVMNSVKSHKPLDEARFAQVRAAFARALPQLAPAGVAATKSDRGPALRSGPNAERLGGSRSRRKLK